MLWVSAYGKTATCCQRATPAEVRANPERYDCHQCELKRRTENLWMVNAEAWRIYQVLCGRLVGSASLHGLALEWVTDGWSNEERVALLRRLDLILDLLSPQDDDGRPRTENPDHRG